MAKSAAQERRELNAALAVLQHRMDYQREFNAEVRADLKALTATAADLRVEVATLRADFAEFKRRAEVRD